MKKVATEICYNEYMKTALLIHGYNGIPKVFGYFQNELEKLGYKTIMPSLPTQQAISFSGWESELNKLNIPTKVSLLIAHSVGNEFMIRYCAKYDLEVELYIGLAGFVESFVHDNRNDLNEVIAKMQCNEQEIQKFRELTTTRYAIYSNDDHIVPYNILQSFPKAISATPVMILNIGHMGKKSGLERLPEVVGIIKPSQ